MISSCPRALALFERGGELFNIGPGQVFDRHAGSAREPERVDQALHAPLVDPVIVVWRDALRTPTAALGGQASRDAARSCIRAKGVGME